MEVVGKSLLLPKQSFAPFIFGALQDRAYEFVEDLESNRVVRKMKKRICLVLDCLCAHDFSDKTADLINLQHYVIKEKRLSERETVVIFYDVVRVVEALHKVPFPHLFQWTMTTNWGRCRFIATLFCMHKGLGTFEEQALPVRAADTELGRTLISCIHL